MRRNAEARCRLAIFKTCEWGAKARRLRGRVQSLFESWCSVVCVQEFMRALQCFMYEFWDLETKPLDRLIADKGATEGLIGGWCVLLPESSRICHIRR